MDTKFHLSLPCNSIKETRKFYIDDLELACGRSSEKWLDVNLYSHQVTFTEAGKFNFNNPNYVFEGKILPSFHFGVIVDVDTWGTIYAKLTSKNLDIVTQATFLKDKLGEHLSFFVKDPNDYMLEFKSFKEVDAVFLE